MAIRTKRGYVYKDCNGRIQWDTFTEDFTYGGKLNWILVEVTCGSTTTTTTTTTP